MDLSRRAFLKETVVLPAGAALLGGCASGVSLNLSKPYSFDQQEGVRIPWPGLEETLRVWVVGDTHLALHDARDDMHADFYRRLSQRAGKGKELFEAMLARAKAERPDALILVGDIISFPTLANVEYLKSLLDACGIPYFYVAGNHDWHFEGDKGNDLEQRKRWTKMRLAPLYQGENPLMYSRRVKGVRIVMIDNSAYHVLPEQVDFWRQEADKGDPVLLGMHIPFWHPGWSVLTCACPTWGAATDPYAEIERRERWAERLLPSTFEFRQAVLDTTNLVGVFSGHMHKVQLASENGQNMFTTSENRKGYFMDVRIGKVTV